ncbi:MAG: hypothetical protein CMP20_09330 [Rickettsiales bacterium]|nr:hypothetical protein [Rickettsiales bacterium]
MSRKRRRSDGCLIALKAQKALDKGRQTARTCPATIIDDSRTYEIRIPSVCTGETLCTLVEDALKEPIDCVDVYMSRGSQEFYRKVWYDDEQFVVRGDVIMQIPTEYRSIILNVVMPSGVLTINCKRFEIVDTLLGVQIEQVYDQDETCLPLDELCFLQSGYTVYTKHNSSV